MSGIVYRLSRAAERELGQRTILIDEWRRRAINCVSADDRARVVNSIGNTIGAREVSYRAIAVKEGTYATKITNSISDHLARRIHIVGSSRKSKFGRYPVLIDDRVSVGVGVAGHLAIAADTGRAERQICQCVLLRIRHHRPRQQCERRYPL